MSADNAEAPLAPLAVGTLIDRYRIEQVDERSDYFSLLYRARDTVDNFEVLLKEFAPAEFMVREGLELRPRSEDARRTIHWGLRGFADQAAGLQSLRLPHVLKVLQVVEANGTAYYASAPLTGESLAARLDREQTLPPNVLLPLVDQLLEPLARIHTAGLLHWDVRPENILIDSDGSPWLVDFGAARFVMRFKFRSIYSVVMPGYAPPEVYSAAARPGPTTDLYSVAATIYRAIAGTAPPDSLRLSRGEATLTPALKIGYGNFPSEFLRAVDWGLRLDPEQRPKSAEQWREVLAGRAPVPAALKGASTAPAIPASPTPRTGSPAAATPASRTGASAPATLAARVGAPAPATSAPAAPALAAVEPATPEPVTPSAARGLVEPTPAAGADIVLPGPAPEFRPESKPMGVMLAAGCALLLVIAVVVFMTHRKGPEAPATAPAAVAARPSAAAPSQAPTAPAVPAATVAPTPAERAPSPPALDRLAANASREQAASQARENERQRKLETAREQEKNSRNEVQRAQQEAANVRPPPGPSAETNVAVQPPKVETAPKPAQAATTTAPMPNPPVQAKVPAPKPAAEAARAPVQAPAPTAVPTKTGSEVAAAPVVRVPPSRDRSHSCAAPQYPSSARFAGETGTTVVELVIGADGSVADSSIATSSGFYDLDQAARIGFSHCKWNPGTVNGKPETARVLVKLSWQLK